MILKEQVRAVVCEEMRNRLMAKDEVRVDESLTAIAVAAGLAAAAITSVITFINQHDRDKWIMSRLKIDVPRAEVRLKEISRMVKLAKNSRDLQAADDAISKFREDILDAQANADSLTIADVKRGLVTVAINDEKAKKVYIKQYKKFLVDLEKHLDKAVDDAYKVLDDLIQGDVGSRAI